MSSETEIVLQALIAAITAQSQLAPPPLPAPSRNLTLPARFAAFGSSGAATAFLNVNDGDGRVHSTALGNPDESLKVYEIVHRAEVEWIVQGSDPVALAAVFDAGLVAINAALAADRSLGGTVDWAEIDETVRTNLVTAALPNTKAIVVYVALTFVSNAPF